jgi:pimeloyl-ACP methyl ester carboxylesterase
MDIFVRECGPSHAPAIILLHGGGISGWMWDRCASLLDDYRCLIPDLPEHGRSRDVKPITIEDSARRIADLIQDRVNGGRAYVAGYSLGGQVLVDLLAMAPQVVDRAVVVSALLRPLPMSGLLSAVSRGVLPLARNRAFQQLQARSFHIPAADFEIYYQDAQRLSTGALGRILNENSSFRMPTGLQEAAAPTLVLAGQKELGVMRYSVRDLTAALPNAQGYLISGADHAYLFAEPERFTSILRAWFSSQQLPEDILIPW